MLFLQNLSRNTKWEWITWDWQSQMGRKYQNKGQSFPTKRRATHYRLFWNWRRKLLRTRTVTTWPTRFHHLTPCAIWRWRASRTLNVPGHTMHKISNHTLDSSCVNFCLLCPATPKPLRKPNCGHSNHACWYKYDIKNDILHSFNCSACYSIDSLSLIYR